jgi:predicted RNA-binding protein with PIN domain
MGQWRQATMPYLIDGHNLIGKLPDISLDDPNDEALLVQKLTGFVVRTQQKCVVVFDHGIPGGVSKMSTYGVQVVFASAHSNADNVIIDRIAKTKNPKQWIVVSEDNRVLSAAKRHTMQTLKSTQFARMIDRPPPPPKPGLDVAEDVHLSEDEVNEWLDLFGGST